MRAFLKSLEERLSHWYRFWSYLQGCLQPFCSKKENREYDCHIGRFIEMAIIYFSFADFSFASSSIKCWCFLASGLVLFSPYSFLSPWLPHLFSYYNHMIELSCTYEYQFIRLYSNLKHKLQTHLASSLWIFLRYLSLSVSPNSLFLPPTSTSPYIVCL